MGGLGPWAALVYVSGWCDLERGLSHLENTQNSLHCPVYAGLTFILLQLLDCDNMKLIYTSRWVFVVVTYKCTIFVWTFCTPSWQTNWLCCERRCCLFRTVTNNFIIHTGRIVKVSLKEENKLVQQTGSHRCCPLANMVENIVRRQAWACPTMTLKNAPGNLITWFLLPSAPESTLQMASRLAHPFLQNSWWWPTHRHTQTAR